MKVGPKGPGSVGSPDVEGAGVDAAVGATGKTGAIRRFADTLGTDGAPATTPAGAPVAADPVADLVARYGAGELTRAETVRGVAETVVGTWPPGLGDATMRARAVEQLVEQLESDPAFTALLDAAAGAPR